ncbi:MAG: hypothetical protein MUP45_03050 [Candidatus Marinimicrobia bacterium]|nr:hypothetical protein [Candidatus Neomarinimicrobiota bacterium]
MFGIYPESSQNQEVIPNPFLPSPETDRRLYQAECRGIFDKVCGYDHDLDGQVGVFVDIGNGKAGLLLRETFTAKDPTDLRKKQFAFLLFPKQIMITGPITPKLIEKLDAVHPQMRLTRMSLARKDLRFRDLLEDEDRELLVDQLRQVANNSIQNAWQAMVQSGSSFPFSA